MKTCRRCLVVKPEAGFWKSTQSICRACHNERARLHLRELARRPNIEVPEHKTCSKCKREQPGSAFSPDRRVLDGLQAQCKECKAATIRARGALLAKRASIVSPTEKKCTACKRVLLSASFTKAKREKSGLMGTCRKCDAVRSGAYVRTHGKAVHREAGKRYRATPGGRVAKNLRWQRRRARLMDRCSPGVTSTEWLEIVEYFGGRCAFCLGPADTIDHIIPLAAGGLDSPENVVPACRACNSSKSDMSLLGLLMQPMRVVTSRMHAVGR